MDSLKINKGKNEFITVDNKKYSRLPIKTKVVSDRDDILNIVDKFAVPYLKENDILFITEKIVACTQKRAIPMEYIKPRRLAKFLSKYVTKTPYGIGLGIPETMEMALRECGTIRILFASVIAAIGKLFGKKGWFYIIAGERARAIDGPCDCTLPPYNNYVVLAPLNPDKVAHEIKEHIGFETIIVDINDLGGNILGISSEKLDKNLFVNILKDNPLGQSSEQTPMGIIREVL